MKGILQTPSAFPAAENTVAEGDGGSATVLRNTTDGSLADYRVRFECGMKCSCSVR